MGHHTLYDRLGKGAGITAVVDDFVSRCAADSRINSNATGADFPPSSSTANHSSNAFWPNSRVVIITKIPPKSAAPTEQPDRARASGAHRRH